ncbi:MAG: phosphomannomutase/phosphoglucomutase [Candidatus Nanopelagicales bacterium]
MPASSVVKAYDIRGVVPEELNKSIIQQIALAVGRLLRDEGEDGIVVGHDMRESAQELVPAFIETLLSLGINVRDVGLVSTDALYFASGIFNLPGAMFTASHNPAHYNGLKLCRRKAVPIGDESGLNQIREFLKSPSTIEPSRDEGKLTQESILDAYADFFVSRFSLDSSKPLRVVVDAANAMAGLTFPIVASRFSFETLPLYFELDGSFPNHEPNPIDSSNLKDLQAKVRETRADIGLAFDGDADRCFIVDENANIVSPSIITALICQQVLENNPGAAIVYNVITSRVVPETIEKFGGNPIKSRVGHSFIKNLMAQHDAAFGGEHSGHYYFKDFWFADSGMFAAFYVLELLASSSLTLSQLVEPFQTWQESGEINIKVESADEIIRALKRRVEDNEILRIDETDGLTIECESWRVNIRMSNTEPLLRLNVLARTKAEVLQLVDEYSGFINEVQPQL